MLTRITDFPLTGKREADSFVLCGRRIKTAPGSAAHVEITCDCMSAASAIPTGKFRQKNVIDDMD
jgi:hypothetical protein